MLNIVDSNAIEIKEGTYKIDSLTLLGVEFKGEKPTFGIVTINNKGAVSEAWLEFNETKVYYSLISGKAEIVDEFSNMNEITCIVENNNNVITNNCN